MGKLNFHSCFVLLFLVSVAICNAQQYNYNTYPNYGNEPRIIVDRSTGVTPQMEQDAVAILRRAYTEGQRTGNQCIILRDMFTDRYPDYIWHVVKANAYAIKYIKSIDLLAGNDRYVLFATKK